MGPTKNTSDFSSGLFIKMIMNRELSSSPKISLPIVDVREVAEAHLKGLTVPEAANKRFILNAEVLRFRDMVAKLAAEFKPDYRLPEGEISYCKIKFASCFDAGAKGMLPGWDWHFDCVNTRSKEILGINYRPTSDSIVEMAHLMINCGAIADKRKVKK